MSNIQSVCVFCGSKIGLSPAYEHEARQLGILLAQRGIRLVYGGGKIGLMGIVADAVVEFGGDTVGIIPEFLKQLEIGNEEAGSLIITDTMHSRKAKMFEMSDAAVVLPGGVGTIEEAMEMMTWKQLRQHTKPIVLVNVDRYWDPLVSLIDSIIEGGFAHAKIRELISIVSHSEQIFEALANAPMPDPKVLTSHL